MNYAMRLGMIGFILPQTLAVAQNPLRQEWLPVESMPQTAVTSGYQLAPGRVVSETVIYSQPPISTSVQPLITSAAYTTEAVANSAFNTTGNVITASAVTAAPLASKSTRLQDILERAKGELDASTLPSMESSKQQLQLAVEELERFIDLDSQNGQAWEKFLRLDELRAELLEDRPNLAVLTDLEMNMRQNHAGLSMTPFTKVRAAIDQLSRAMRYGAAPERTIELLGTKIDELIVKLEDPIEGSAIDRDSAIGLVLSYLHDSEQVPWAVSEIRKEFSTPNVRFSAQEATINRLIGRSISEPTPVNECLLGTRIVGNACLSGSVTADLLPMNNGVSLSLNMSAMMTSQNRGYNRGVVLNSSGSSPINASKQIFVTPNGISSAPANVSTNLQTTIHSIEHRLRIVRKIAKKKAAEQKPKADRIAQGRLQSRVQTRYDEQIEEQLAEANTKLAGFKVERPAVARLGIDRPSFSIYSTDYTVNGDVTQANSYQLAASAPSPIASSSSEGIVLAAHQSAAINLLDVALGGRTIRSKELDDFAKQFLDEVPAELAKEAAGEEWSITLAPFHPVELMMDDGKVTIVLRISQMTRGEQSLADPASISVTYVPEYQDGIIRMTREGEVAIDFVRISGGIRATTMRSFLETKFNTVFKPEIVTEKINLKERFPNAPDLDVKTVTLEDGWIQLGVN